MVRLGAMGDILHALPAVTALRLAHPDWHIGWVVEPRWQALLRAGDETTGNRDQGTGIREGRSPAMPLVERLHFAAMRGWKRHPLSRRTASEIKALSRELRADHYDAVLDFQGAIRSAVIARAAGSKRIVGEAHPREWPAHWLFAERVVTLGAHVVEQDLELASAVAGDELAFTEPMLPVDADAERWCDARLGPAPGASSDEASRRIALLAPGAGWGAKRWPPGRYANVARGLADRGFRVLVNAGPGEEPLAAPIVATGAATAMNATLPQLIALTRRISLCIAGDTGPLHLAAALGRTVVGIYGPTDPSRNGPYGTHARVLRSPGSRRDHSRRSEPDPGLLTISAEDVLCAADELLAEESGR